MPIKELLSRKISVAALVSLGAVAAVLSLSGAGHGHSRANPAAAANTSLPEVTVAAVIHRPLREWQEFSGSPQC